MEIINHGHVQIPLLVNQTVMQQLEAVSQVVQNWPAWKRGHLELSNRSTNSVPRAVEVEQPNDDRIGVITVE